MKIRPLFLSLLFSIPIASYSQAAEDVDWYNVELIVFKQNKVEDKDEEIWPPNIEPVTLPANAAEILPAEITIVTDVNAPIPVPTPFSQIPDQSQKLVEIREKLEKSEEYEVLLYESWRQPVSKGGKSQPVLITDEAGFNAYQEYEPVPEQADAAAAPTPESELLQSLLEELDTVKVEPSDFDGYAVMPVIEANDPIQGNWGFDIFTEDTDVDIPNVTHAREPVGPPELRVYGTTTLRLSRFLHLDLDLYHRVETEPLFSAQELEPVFPMADGVPLDSIQTPPVIVPETEFTQRPIDFRLRDSQRISLKQVNYFDHPLFGVIVVVREYEPDEEHLQQ